MIDFKNYLEESFGLNEGYSPDMKKLIPSKYLKEIGANFAREYYFVGGHSGIKMTQKFDHTWDGEKIDVKSTNFKEIPMSKVEISVNKYSETITFKKFPNSARGAFVLLWKDGFWCSGIMESKTKISAFIYRGDQWISDHADEQPEHCWICDFDPKANETDWNIRKAWVAHDSRRRAAEDPIVPFKKAELRARLAKAAEREVVHSFKYETGNKTGNKIDVIAKTGANNFKRAIIKYHNDMGRLVEIQLDPKEMIELAKLMTDVAKKM